MNVEGKFEDDDVHVRDAGEILYADEDNACPVVVAYNNGVTVTEFLGIVLKVYVKLTAVRYPALYKVSWLYTKGYVDVNDIVLQQAVVTVLATDSTLLMVELDPSIVRMAQ